MNNNTREEDDKYKKFQCKICLDLASEPVITPCGHLYCWQCLYKWAKAKSPLKCPYCSNVFELSQVTTIFTGDAKEGEKKSEIPKRPQNPRNEAPQQQQNGFGNNVQFSFGMGFPFMMFSTFNLNQFQQGNARTFMIIFFIGIFLLNFFPFSDSYTYETQQTVRQSRRNAGYSFESNFMVAMAIMGGFAGLNSLARKIMNRQ